MENKNEVYVECPYNKSHQILASRMQFHLVKCKKQHAAIDDKLICPFDATHHLDKNDYESHLETCPNRKVIESHYYHVGKNSDETIDLHQNITLPTQSENWDDDDAKSYDPSQKTEQLPVFRALEGGTKSERKAFRLGERARIQDLKIKEEKKKKEKNQQVFNVDLSVDIPVPQGGARLRTPSQSSFNQALQRSQEIALSHHNAIDEAKNNRLEKKLSSVEEKNN